MDSHCQLFNQCFKSRSPADWTELVRRCEPRLRTTLRHLAPDGVGGMDLDDMVQELYVRILKNGRRFRGKSDVHFWRFLTRIATHLVIDLHRRARADKRDRRRLFRELRLCGNAVAPATPEERLLQREQLSHFVRAFDRCASRCREPARRRIFSMAYIEGLSSREIAARLGNGTSQTAVDTMLHRLRRQLGDRGIRLCRRSPGRAVVARTAGKTLAKPVDAFVHR